MKKAVIAILTKFFGCIARYMPPAVIHNNLPVLSEKIEKRNDAFFSYHLRPKKASGVSLKGKPVDNRIGIVIQGPLVETEDFTLETVRLYKTIFKGANIVVSTWEDSDASYAARIKELGVTVLMNKKPGKPGALNSNYQVFSTISGIYELEKNNVEYILKTRSDQRIYNSQTFNLVLGLIRLFPPTSPLQTSRIVSVNFTTLKYRPYSIGDMCMFGAIQDMKKYWEASEDEREIDRRDIMNLSIGELFEKNVAETYYCTNYLKKLGVPTPPSIINSIEVYRNYFIVIDSILVDLFWYKYDYEIEHRHRYYNKNLFELFSFSDWLSDRIESFDEEDMLRKKDGSILH